MTLPNQQTAIERLEGLLKHAQSARQRASDASRDGPHYQTWLRVADIAEAVLGNAAVSSLPLLIEIARAAEKLSQFSLCQRAATAQDLKPGFPETVSALASALKRMEETP